MISIMSYTWAGARQFAFDFAGDLATGQTVASVAATHVPPSGDAVTPTVVHTTGQSTGLVIIPALSVTGRHVIRLVATYATPTSGGVMEVIVDVVG